MLLPIGEKIRILRERSGLSQTELGCATNMTQRKVSYIERGTSEPSLDDIIALCCYFHVSADSLLDLPKSLEYLDIF